MNQKLIARGEAKPASKRLTKACSDCPMRRDSLKGWLGGASPVQYKHLAHSDHPVECHVHAGSPCAGMAIYRTNVCQWQNPEDKLPGDTEAIFGMSTEFLEHHSKIGS